MAKRPAFQFFPGDWRRDTALQSRSLLARGLWHEMLCLMHDGEPYGHLAIAGRPIGLAQLARMVGEEHAAVEAALAELEAGGVFSRRADGAIYSRRMVRDEQLRERRAGFGHLGAQSGKLGGRPRRARAASNKNPFDEAGRGFKKPLDPEQNNPPAARQYADAESSSLRSTTDPPKPAKSRRDEQAVDLPAWVPQQQWFEYLAHRATAHKPIKSAVQATATLRKLERLMELGHDPAAVLEDSVANGWTGIFPLEGGKHGHGKLSYAEQTRRNAAIALERMRSRAAGADSAGGNPPAPGRPDEP